MKTVCSNSMPYVAEAFGELGEVEVKEGRAIGPADVRGADLLAVRSTTAVGETLLAGSPIRFVGTATIGIDHLDTAYLEQAGIRWCYAPGCNANSVSEYIAAALLCLARRHDFVLRGLTLGIVGVGHVGSLVELKARALGMRVLRNDPPRERTEGPGRFVSLDRLLAESDIVTLHVPLNRDGPDATLHLADGGFFERLKPGAVFLNAARGAVVDTDALLRALASGRVAHAAIDTWEGEPACPPALAAAVDLATPHIAGYSFDGKVAGTRMVYDEACRFLGRPVRWRPEELLPPPPVPELYCDARGSNDEQALRELVRRVYDIEADDRAFRRTLGGGERERALAFDRLRKQYPVRREFRFTRVDTSHAPPRLRRLVRDFGFA